MGMFKKLAVLAGAAGAVGSYVKKNPEKVNQAVDKAARFADQKTKGKYSDKINGVTQKVSDATKPRPAH
ncbi:antitoxin [Amycolatopsis rhabdoformis]|uniref:Antitoxin n=1 Tax=Amycolatopsis rhabdoformis TaxID=1448059 RepID=A0ABZ1IKW6_9PSEU|nr:antitoxin [Amycolatopsis rhabdoformis]WSE35174.1 antitoxin [Amycolatopsis rhabdoformis]